MVIVRVTSAPIEKGISIVISIVISNSGSDSDVAYGPPPTGAGVDAPDMQRTAEAVLSFFDALRGCCIEFGGRVPWDHLVLVNR